MKLIPTFFLRTSIRILLLQSFLAWLWLHLDKLPLSITTNLAIGSAIGMVVNILKNTLDDNLGFITPWDTPYFLPMLLDEYIITTMPDLAVLLGESPCSKRVAGTHAETGICEPELAYACLQHATDFEAGRLSLEFVRACNEDYGVPADKARKHHERCHAKSEHSDVLGIRACTRAKEQIEKNKEVCFYLPPLIDCTIQYSKWEDLGILLRSAGYRGDEHLEQGVCEKRVLGDTYIDDRFRGLKVKG
ncbi:hypothetical protein M436DRAFT_83124 [Aureobasidium namibiae CBS 147.97]|uniref:Uncharacterized protein n=1 Tax=Aureobasidium namibiae CBS 147.97 TaxID=1043004 RepID=A0A074WGM3_9PEZI